MRRIVIVVIVLSMLVATATPSRAQIQATFPGASSILWVGAHPDDEVLVAPLLARVCIQEKLVCTLLVLSKGEAGSCMLSSGCHPDVGTVRSREMQRSASLLNATLRQWELPDGGIDPIVAGPSNGAERRFVELLDQVQPDLILTFDPRHGSTCHADHRAAGKLVLKALQFAAHPPPVYLLETRVEITQSPQAVVLTAAAPVSAGVVGFDAKSTWPFLMRVVRSHASQFDRSMVNAHANVQVEDRMVYFALASSILTSDTVWSCE